jgi:hypothetical protein
MLGVATDGIYYFTDPSEYDDYQAYFASEGRDMSENAGEEGFLVGPSGDDLIVFTRLLNVDIYLATTSDVAAASPEFGGLTFAAMGDTGQSDGYLPYDPVASPYYAVNLGPVDENNGWEAIPQGTQGFGSHQYYTYRASLTYNGTLPFGSYFFSAADIEDNGLYFNNSNDPEGNDSFSPKTSSAVTTAVPEPSTILLLATGLGSLCAYGSRRKKKKK